MTIVLNTKTYKADSFEPDRVKYFGPAHTGTSKDILSVSRVAPKPTATFRGVNRQQLKLTRTVTLDDGKTADVIVDISGSIPVGCPSAAITSMVADGADLLALEEAGTTTVMAKSIINY